MKFKKGDIVRCLPGGIDIWVKSDKTYEVIGFEIRPEEPPKKMKRYIYPGVEIDCTCDMCTKPRPAVCFIVVNGELGKPATIHEDCFEKME